MAVIFLIIDVKHVLQPLNIVVNNYQIIIHINLNFVT
jgi:hypothetical protein